MNFQLTNFFGEFYNSHNPKNEVEEIDPISLYEQWLYNIYTSRLFANNHEFGTADSKFNHIVKNFTPINERLCVLRIKGRLFSTTLSSTYMHQQITQNRRPRTNFMNSWSGHTQPAQVMARSW
jgi:hypothetical protein